MPSKKLPTSRHSQTIVLQDLRIALKLAPVAQRIFNDTPQAVHDSTENGASCLFFLPMRDK
jgi:hypothetical protein